MAAVFWGIDSRGRIKIESKDDMRKRGLPSPDRADAMAIAFAGRANAAPMNVESHAGEHHRGSHDEGVVTYLTQSEGRSVREIPRQLRVQLKARQGSGLGAVDR